VEYFAGSLGEYCTETAWPEYASSTDSDEDWIQYLNRRWQLLPQAPPERWIDTLKLGGDER